MAGASRVVGACRALQSEHKSSSPRISEERRIQRSCRETIKMAAAAAVSCNAAVIVSPEKQKKPLLDFMELPSSLAAEAARTALGLFRPSRIKEHRRSLRAEIFFERVVVGCRSFTLIGVAGSLIGSILCFVEGCFLVIESFFKYFHTISHMLDQEGIMQLLLEAIDAFVVGTALLTFGMGLYVTFVGPNKMKQTNAWAMAHSNSFGPFSLNRLSDSMEMRSITGAKSKIGHAVVLILQSGVVEKFKNVPVTSGLDLACFAGAVLIASASIFLLSKLTMQPQKQQQTKRMRI